MNKITKGIVAIGAGIALTVGGAGSLAYWQSQTSTGAVTLTTGNMDISALQETWSFNGETIVAPDDDSPRNTIAMMPLVPGSTIVWEQEYDINQNGTDLLLVLDVELGGITAQPMDYGRDLDMWDGSDIVPSYTITSTSDLSLTQIRGNTYEVVGEGSFVVTTTLAWDFDADHADTSNLTEGKTLDFADSTVTLSQVSSIPTNNGCGRSISRC